jgi:hypothetical protein
LPVERDPFDRVRELCLSLPETSERLSHGRLAIYCAAPEGVQQALVGWDAIAGAVEEAHETVEAKL